MALVLCINSQTDKVYLAVMPQSIVICFVTLASRGNISLLCTLFCNREGDATQGDGDDRVSLVGEKSRLVSMQGSPGAIQLYLANKFVSL
jgi:hypothetical protein